jgi:hypothetical protein
MKIKTRRNAKSIQRSKVFFFTFILVIILVTISVFLFPTDKTGLNRPINVPLYKYVRTESVDGSYNRPSPIPTPKIVTVEPKIEGNKLVTPKITKLSLPKIISFMKNDNWEYKDYSFKYCSNEEGVCQFNLNIVYKTDPNYKISIYDIDTGFGNCDFNPNHEEKTYFIILDEYQDINTNFGLIKIGKQRNSSTFVVCQKGVQSIKDKNQGWVAFTDLGFIDVHNPKDYDPAIIVQMLSIIANTSVENLK